MNKFSYRYCVYRNNCCDGVYFVKAFNKLIDALKYKEYLQSFSGCCDVVKKRFFAGAEKPANIYIINNYKYSEYDVF